MPLPDAYTIRSGPLGARFLPENGGRMSHLTHDLRGNILVPTQDQHFDPLNWPKAGAYPLFPFHNRLVGAAFEHQGKQYKVQPHPALAPDAQHGPAHRRPWTVSGHDEYTIEMVLDYHADEDWPFDFQALQRFKISDDSLEVELAITNNGDFSMPAGFGWHPYFAAPLGASASCDASQIWPVGPLGIPTGEAPERRKEHKLLTDSCFTIFLSGWSAARLNTAGGAIVTLAASSALPHLVAHRTPDYLCLEPVSHVAGGLNFPPAQAWAGLFVMQPGETRSAVVKISIQ